MNRPRRTGVIGADPNSPDPLRNDRTMILIDQVTRTYTPPPLRGRTITALEELSLEVPEGAAWAVVGPNGAGKSTLFALILGFLRPTSGSITIDGLEPRAFLRRDGAAYLPERFSLPAEWPVASALNALARLEGLRGREARRRVDDAIARLDLGAHASRPLASLSRGLLQRVGLAQTLLGDGRIVILDEPTEGLDPIWRIEFRRLIAEFRGAGRTILIASHDLAEVERVTEQAVLLEAGRIREIIPISRKPAGRRRYRLVLARPIPAFAEIFPDATTDAEDTGIEQGAGDDAPDDVAHDSSTASAAYLVEVDDEADLSTSLAALLAAGAILREVAPAGEPLEERVRHALSGGGR